MASQNDSGDSADDNCPHCGRVRDLQFWRTLTEREKYRSSRIGRLELEGKLIRRELADETIAELGAITRSLLEAIPPSIRADLAAESNARKCGDIVGDAIRLVLQQVAEQFAGLAGSPLAVEGEEFDEATPDVDDDDA